MVTMRLSARAWFEPWHPAVRLATADRRVVGHQLALRAVAREAHDDDAAGLGADDHALAERGVYDVVTEAEDVPAVAGELGARRGGAGPRGDAAGRGQAGGFPLRLVGQLARDLVEEARAHAVGVRPERVAPAREGQREVAHRAREADVGEPPLLL